MSNQQLLYLFLHPLRSGQRGEERETSRKLHVQQQKGREEGRQAENRLGRSENKKEGLSINRGIINGSQGF